MSEKIYSWFLRLYPSRFRESYGDEALQLFRDRARDEKGFVPRVRLWLDLLADLAISVPREYYHFQPEFFGVSARRLEGVPAFFVLEDGSPRPGALFSGGMLTLACVITFSVWISQPARYRPLRFSTTDSQGSTPGRSSAFRGSARAAVDNSSEKTGTGRKLTDATDSKPSGSKPRGSSSAVAPIGETDRHRVILGAVKNLKEHYVYPAVAQKVADALLANEKNGDYDNARMLEPLLTC